MDLEKARQIGREYTQGFTKGWPPVTDCATPSGCVPCRLCGGVCMVAEAILEGDWYSRGEVLRIMSYCDESDALEKDDIRTEFAPVAEAVREWNKMNDGGRKSGERNTNRPGAERRIGSRLMAKKEKASDQTEIGQLKQRVAELEAPQKKRPSKDVPFIDQVLSGVTGGKGETIGPDGAPVEDKVGPQEVVTAKIVAIFNQAKASNPGRGKRARVRRADVMARCEGALRQIRYNGVPAIAAAEAVGLDLKKAPGPEKKVEPKPVVEEVKPEEKTE